MNNMEESDSEARFVVCIKNDGYPASLDVRKIYQVVPDAKVPAQLVRVIDESGEDYLYPADYFAPIVLPHSLAKALTLAA